MKYRYILFLILGIDALILFYQTTQLSISYDEARLIYEDKSFLTYIINASIGMFGQNDFALRLPMIIFHLLSALLLYTISNKYIKNERNKIWLVLIFILLPGVISAAIVVNSAGFVIFALFLFLFIYEKFKREYIYPLLIIFSIIEQDFFYLFLSLVVFSLYEKNKYFFILNFLLITVSIYLYGVPVKGIPSGYFLDTLGIYAAVFTPIIFIYLFYVLYRRFLGKDIDIIWFVSTVTFVYTLLLSFRQRVGIEHIAPYLIVALPLAANTFISSYYVRLKEFRTTYRNIFILSFIFLITNTFIVFFNKELYLFIENPKKHFAYKMHIVKELAIELKKDNINCISTNKQMQLRLKFYKIDSCNVNNLEELDLNNIDEKSVTVSYANKVVYNATVTKLNSK